MKKEPTVYKVTVTFVDVDPAEREIRLQRAFDCIFPYPEYPGTETIVERRGGRSVALRGTQLDEKSRIIRQGLYRRTSGGS